MQRLKAVAGGVGVIETGILLSTLEELLKGTRRNTKPFFLRGAGMKIIAYTELTENGLLIHYSTIEVKQEILHLYQASKEKYNGYFKIDIQKPYPTRTTGEGSQNNKFYALVTEICKETGNDLEDVKDALKERAIKRGKRWLYNERGSRNRIYNDNLFPMKRQATEKGCYK